MPLRCRLGHRQTSTPKGFIKLWQPTTVASYESHGFTPWAIQTPTIHSYHTPSFLLVQHSNLFSSNSNLQNPFTFSTVDLLSRRLPTHSPYPFFHYGQTIRENLSVLSSTPFATPHNSHLRSEFRFFHSLHFSENLIPILPMPIFNSYLPMHVHIEKPGEHHQSSPHTTISYEELYFNLFCFYTNLATNMHTPNTT